MSQITTTKKIIAITTISLGSIGFANAQVPNTTSTQPNFGQRIMQNLTDTQKSVLNQAKSLFEAGKKDEAKTLLEKNNLQPKHANKLGQMEKRMGKKELRKDNRGAIHEAIASGNFAEFQKLAATTPMAKIDQTTFNSLTPHFTALKNARTNIENILKTAGIEKPQMGHK